MPRVYNLYSSCLLVSVLDWGTAVGKGHTSNVSGCPDDVIHRALAPRTPVSSSILYMTPQKRNKSIKDPEAIIRDVLEDGEQVEVRRYRVRHLRLTPRHVKFIPWIAVWPISTETTST